MKTNQEILNVVRLIDVCQQLKNEELKPFKYAFLRNKLKFQKVIEERDEVVKYLKEEFETNVSPKDKNYDKKWNEFLENSTKLKDFLAEEVDIEYYTISLSKLENDPDFSFQAANIFLGTIIID